jgi:AcrR family transcriptional regulator
MARIIKKAEERRTEILDVARRLFLSRGYDATTVNDLISAVGISKGAFYHHFASKDDVLRALVWSMAEQGLAAMVPLFEQKDLTPLEKLKAFFKDGQKYKKENSAALRSIIEVLFREENLRLRLQAAEQMTEIIVPHLGKVLEQGAKLGEFHIEEPEETARLVLNLGSLLHEAFAVALKLGESRKQEAIVLLRKRADSCERAIERLLGIPKHGLSIIDPDLIELFLVSPSGGTATRSIEEEG